MYLPLIAWLSDTFCFAVTTTTPGPTTTAEATTTSGPTTTAEATTNYTGNQTYGPNTTSPSNSVDPFFPDTSGSFSRVPKWTLTWIFVLCAMLTVQARMLK